MPRSPGKSRLNTTIDTDLLKSFKILAVQEDKRLNQLLEESIRDVLVKYERKSSLPAKSLVPKREKREQEKSDPNSLRLQGVEAMLHETVNELRNAVRAIESGPKKVFSVVPALTGLVIGLILSGAFFTAKYSDLVRYKVGLDARAITASHSEDCSAKTAKVGIVENSIEGQKDESDEFRALRIDGQTQLVGMQPQGMVNVGMASKVKGALPTTHTTPAGILATEVENHSRAASEIPALTELFSCKLSAIAWDQNPDLRLVVIGDRVVHEGDEVGGATVLRINPDHVVFSSQDEVFIKRINSEPSGDGEQHETAINETNHREF